MDRYRPYVIKSFKHNGQLHRMWLENWLVPPQSLTEEHRNAGTIVLINHRTKIVENNGKEWVSRVPAVSFFLPGQWFNVVALIEDDGVRFYCNVASPPYMTDDTLTYIDYDLDVVYSPAQSSDPVVLDEAEYEAHKIKYKYSELVERKVRSGLSALLAALEGRRGPFREDVAQSYYETWVRKTASGGGS